MQTKMSNKAGFGLLEAMIAVAMIGLSAAIAVRHVEGVHQPWPFELTQILTQLKWIWMAVFISSSLAALTFKWLRSPAKSGNRPQNQLAKHQLELQLQ
jgi:type II secretory pathway component PulJ